MPPATTTTWPETWPERRSEARTTICHATSSGWATLRSGIVCVIRSSRPGSASAGEAISVSVQPGQTAFARPSGARRAISFLSVGRRPPVSAAFVAA